MESQEKPKKKPPPRRTKFPKAFPNTPATISRQETALKRQEEKERKALELKKSLVRVRLDIRKFKSPEDLAEKLNEYFEYTPLGEWTITGLCLALDTTKDAMYRYEKREEYTDLIKKARLLVEHSYELALKQNGKAGDIFALKNFGWRDDKAFTLSGPNGGAIQQEWKIEVVDPVTKQVALIGEDNTLIEVSDEG